MRIHWAINLFFLLVVALPTTSAAYVYLAPQKPRIVPADGRVQVFYLTEQAPSFADKQSFEEGTYAEFTDSEVFLLLTQRAMNYWNEIPQLSIQLRASTVKTGAIDADDNLFSVGIGEITTVASGLAYPVPDENDPSRLRDCDIQVGTDIDSIPAFIFVMIHEFGHCLGLGHNHSDPDAIMGYWQPRQEVRLGLDDIAGVLSLYPPVAGDKVAPFAPCGSLAGHAIVSKNLSARGREHSTFPGAKWYPLFVFGFLLMPVCAALLCAGFTSWSCRRRRQ